MIRTVEFQNVFMSGRRGEILRDLSFFAQAGEEIALFGPSGGGKSTILNLMSGRFQPDSGTIGLRSTSNAETVRIGAAEWPSRKQTNGSPYKHVQRSLAVNGIPISQRPARLIEALDACCLMDVRDIPLSELGSGAAILAVIASAIAHRPQILLLDNITASLPDPPKQVLETYLRERRSRDGLTVVRATSSSDEACKADRVLVLDAGNCLAFDMPNALLEKYGEDHITLEAADPSLVRTNLRGIHDVEIGMDGSTMTFRAKSGEDHAARLLRLPAGGVRIVIIRQPTMWDVLERIKSRMRAQVAAS